MKITVISVVYNDVENFKVTAESVLSQQYEQLEYIIIDGGSTDGTREVVEKYTGERRVRSVSEPDNGIYDAMNKGAALATGDYILFLNAGDTFHADDVCSRFAALDVKEDLVHGAAMYRHPGGVPWIFKGDLGLLFKVMPLSHQACFVKRQVQNMLKFDLSFRVTADYDFLLRAHNQGCSFRKIEIIVSNYCMDGVSSTDIFRSSIESMHALLNYDTEDTLDLRETECFSRIIVEKLLDMRDGALLDNFLCSVRACRKESVSKNPFRKIQSVFSVLSVGWRLYKSG